MRARLLCAVVAIACLLMVPVHAGSHDDEAPVDFGFEKKNDWGDLHEDSFGPLVMFGWLCGNFSQVLRSFDLEHLAPDLLSPTLALAVRHGAGRAPLHIIESVFELGRENAIEELERREWFKDFESKKYKVAKENLIKNLPDIKEICIDNRNR